MMIKKIAYKLREYRVIRVFFARFAWFNFFGKQIKPHPKTLKVKDLTHIQHNNKKSTQSTSVDKSHINKNLL